MYLSTLFLNLLKSTVLIAAKLKYLKRKSLIIWLFDDLNNSPYEINMLTLLILELN